MRVSSRNACEAYWDEPWHEPWHGPRLVGRKDQVNEEPIARRFVDGRGAWSKCATRKAI